MKAGDEGAYTVDPKRVYALIVGIESYEVGSTWDLPGAARDALRFAAWLTGRGKVPADNVRLLISPLQRSDLTTVETLPSGLREAVQPATQENVETALFEDLPQCDGDLMWIFWAGHGFVDDRHHQLLPYTNATRMRPLHLNLESALRKWKSSHVKAGRFDRQVVIGDACRVRDHPNSELHFDDCSYKPGNMVVPNRGQFVLYASRPGEAAQNLAERSAGQFTDLFLSQLQTRTLEQTVTELVGIAREVQASFGKLHRVGLAWQRPQFVIDRDWDGSTLFGDERWMDTAAGGPLRLDQDAWDQLGVLLKQRSLLPDTYEAYRWAFDVAGCVPPTTARLPAEGLMDLVRDLDSRQGGRAMPLTLPFLRYLASRIDDPAWAGALDTWVTTTCKRLGTEPVPAPPERSPSPTGLHVQMTEATQERTYWLRIWLYRGHFECIWAPEQPVDLAGARELLGQQLSALYAKGTQEGTQGGTPQLKRLEFHIPFDLLDEGFEHWTAPIGRGGKEQALGHGFEVVVRCPDERTGTAHDYWQRKWQWLNTHSGGQHPEAVRLLDDAGLGMTMSFHTDDPPVCVLAEVSGRHLTDVLNDMLDGGIPIAVWHRGGRPELTPSNSGGLASVLIEDPIDQAAETDLRKLPAVLHRLRTQNAREAQWHPLALMWDDPDLRPDDRSLA